MLSLKSKERVRSPRRCVNLLTTSHLSDGVSADLPDLSRYLLRAAGLPALEGPQLVTWCPRRCGRPDLRPPASHGVTSYPPVCCPPARPLLAHTPYLCTSRSLGLPVPSLMPPSLSGPQRVSGAPFSTRVSATTAHFLGAQRQNHPPQHSPWQCLLGGGLDCNAKAPCK